MPPEKPPQMPKRAMDSSFKEEHPRASNGEFTKGNAEKPTENRYNEKKRRYRDLSHEPMITKINPSWVNKFPEQVFKNLAKAKKIMKSIKNYWKLGFTVMRNIFRQLK